MTPTIDPAFEFKQLADELYWCLVDRYRADGDSVIKGPNEVVAFYSRPNEDEAIQIAAALEAVIAPVRRRRAVELLAKLSDMLGEIRQHIS